jgi:hypothetical protein
LAALAAVIAVAAAVRAGGPPVPTDPPQLFTQIGYWDPGSRRFEAHTWVQFARPESLDLVRLAPRRASVPRVEASIHPDLLVLQAQREDPQTFRVRVPLGSPIACNYDVTLRAAADAPHAVGADYLCVWLGEALLAPLRPEKPATFTTRVPGMVGDGLDAATGAERFWLEAQLPDHWHAYGPWRTENKVFRPATLGDQIDNFLALGVWRTSDALVGEASACTLQVALAGTLPVADAAWSERAVREVGAAGIHGRALVCIAPSPGALQVWPARRSWLVLWPGDAKELPPLAAAPAKTFRLACAEAVMDR